MTDPETSMTIPWQIITGCVVLAASLGPAWTIDLSNAPTETSIRFWTTLILAAALFGTLRGISAFRWVLALLLGMGVVVSAASYVAAATIEVQALLITIAQVGGLVLLFTPAANEWFRARREGAMDGEADIGS